MSDLIERQAAIDVLKGLPTWWADEGGYYGGAQPPMVALLDPEDAVSAIENLPSAQPDRKTGWWLIRKGISDVQCSECGMYFNDVYDMENSDAFCRHCGTKMEGLKVVKNE